MASNIYKQFYGQGNGGYTAEHQLPGRVRRSAQNADAGASTEPEQYVPRLRRKANNDADDLFESRPVAPAPAPVAQEAAPVQPAEPQETTQTAPAEEQVQTEVVTESSPAETPVQTVETTPAEEQPTAQEPAPVQPAPVAQEPAPMQPAPTAQEPAPMQPAPTAQEPAPMQPAPVAQEPAPMQPAPVEADDDIEIIEEAMDTKAAKDITDVSDEDVFNDDLLAQIDAFRKKAEQLQELIAQKQQRAEQLKNIVEAKESQVQGLEGLLAKSHAQNREMAEDLKSNVNGQIEVLRQEMNNQILAMSGEVKNQIDSVTASLGNIHIQGSDLEGVSNEVKNLKQNMDGLQEAIVQKLHNESVESYRNTADLLKNIGPSEEEAKDRRRIEGQVKNTRGSIRFLTVFSIVNFALLAVLSLYELGILSTF